jgi:hypothetical protein
MNPYGANIWHCGMSVSDSAQTALSSARVHRGAANSFVPKQRNQVGTQTGAAAITKMVTINLRFTLSRLR